MNGHLIGEAGVSAESEQWPLDEPASSRKVQSDSLQDSHHHSLLAITQCPITHSPLPGIITHCSITPQYQSLRLTDVSMVQKDLRNHFDIRLERGDVVDGRVSHHWRGELDQGKVVKLFDTFVVAMDVRLLHAHCLDACVGASAQVVRADDDLPKLESCCV